jgi:hypothetical protein
VPLWYCAANDCTLLAWLELNVDIARARLPKVLENSTRSPLLGCVVATLPVDELVRWVSCVRPDSATGPLFKFRSTTFMAVASAGYHIGEIGQGL